jgi:hypothetical protein
MSLNDAHLSDSDGMVFADAVDLIDSYHDQAVLSTRVGRLAISERPHPRLI